MDLFEILNQSNYIFYFLVVDNFLDIQLPQLKNFHLIYAFSSPIFTSLRQQQIPYFCLEEKNISLAQKNTGRLLSSPQVINYINSTAGKKTPVIIPFKPSAKIEIICRQHNWICAAVSHQLNRFLENKNEFFNFCQKNNLPIIKGFIDKFNQSNFTKYQQKLDSKLVIQTHFGWAGNSTHLAENWHDVSDKIPSETTVKFSPLLQGYSLINNCCLTSSGLIQSPPALQYTGLKTLTPNPFTTVGRQWPSMAPQNINQQVIKITQEFSQLIKSLNYRGFFGLDFFVNQNSVYLLECNPRLTASFAFYTRIEINHSLNPLFLFHLAEFTNLNPHIDINQHQQLINQTDIIGSEITLKNKSNQTIKKYNDFVAFSQSTNPVTIPPHIIDLLHETN
ncbi:MAG TPA: ATP-grasp domain-containing protein [Candidatus Woesebacteria bacterium]|jgi:hypothetical protein|nr:ATP-grasp domain-containing protein [Candidatus Shapirobacteria bacterium]HOR01685.1 ATP-grasp domain-containing protein [Candidatus Woesebacteria bacterium]